MNTKTLIIALLDGAILQQIHNNNDFLDGGIEYLYSYIQNDQICFESKGFKTNEYPENRVIDLFNNPNNWSICEKSMKDGYPYPWS